mgnify:CR=1 FL=1
METLNAIKLLNSQYDDAMGKQTENVRQKARKNRLKRNAEGEI